jgi:hypothetical protein
MVFGASLLELYQRYWFWYVLTHPFIDPSYLSEVLMSGIVVFAVPAYSTVGAIVASLRPKNGVGWLCLALSLVMVVGNWQPVNAALENLASIVSGLAWALTPLAVALLLLIFPDGRLLSRRWWAVVGMTVGGLLLGALAELLPAYSSVAELVANIAFSILFVALASAAVAVVLRWHRSRNQERQQIKLLFYTIAVTAVAILSAFMSSYVLNDIPGAESYPTVLATVVALGGIALGIPVAIGLAVLRYRLYDIDLLINRTLVYGSLTAVLAGVYLVGIVLFQALFRTLTGQESQLAVVASTLAIAALFTPLRHRIKAFIDRRFYRRKYDAAKTLEAFSVKLRDETDLGALRDDLVGVVRETMEPEHISLWLRPNPDSKGDDGSREPGR